MSRFRRHWLPAGAVLGLLAVWAAFELQGTGTNSAEPLKPAPPPPTPFDGKRALNDLRDLCKLGPRVSGSAAMKKQQEMVKAHFEKLGAKVEFQPFKASQESRPDPVEMVNIIVSWHPDKLRRALLCTHYDTRPRADQEEDVRKWREPFMSANDGTSGVAWMMELARNIGKLKTEVGVDFVLFDGEEYVFDGPTDGRDRYFLGSEHFAQQYRRSPPKHKYVAAILLDLFAGQNAIYPVEQNSHFLAGALVQEVWRTAAELGVPAFRNRLGHEVRDDHLALNRIANIPAIDIIDFDYKHWHRLSDTPDQCSAESMEQVAKVLTVWLQRVR